MTTSFRVMRGDGGGSSLDARDLQEILRQRLRFVAISGVILAVVFAVTGIAINGAGLIEHPSRLFVNPPFVGIMVLGGALDFALALFLAPRRQPSLRALRTVEWIYVIMGIAAAFQIFTRSVESTVAEYPAMVYVTAQGFAVIWVSMMLLLGLLLPNTWQRCAAIIAFMLVCALVPDAIILLRSTIVPTRLAMLFLITKGVYCCGAAAFAVYGAYRIEVLRQDAIEGRELGQYILREQIGAGGMGEVYRADHKLLRRPCAVKIIRPERGGDEATLARFEREVQATATLTHPNTVQIYDYGRADDGTFYYVMEYLPGESLEQIVERDGPMSAERAAHLLSQLCRALREAHSLGLVHRDIKPSNVIVCERGGERDVAKLLDFGLVASTAPLTSQLGGGKLTESGLLLGTPEFMSPEQCGGDVDVGPASDIYSLGALGYYLLSGRSPFAGRGAMQMIVAHLREEPPALTARGMAVPAALEAAIMTALSKNPSDRHADAEAFDLALSGSSRPSSRGMSV